MNAANGSLIRAKSRSLTKDVAEQEPSVFWKFREVFRAEWCMERKIYWYDRKWGRTRLWQVLNPQRQNKKEDKLIATFVGDPDVDVLRFSLAAANRGLILTGVRWELYCDFDCTDLVQMGRFDVLDLFPRDQEKLSQVLKNDAVGVSLKIQDWDFDGIFLTHRCPRCGKAYGKDLLCFIPRWMECSFCGYSGFKKTEPSLVINTMLALLGQITREDKGRFMVPRTEGVPLALHFIDVAATPVICWLVGEYCMGQPYLVFSGHGLANQALEIGRVEECLRRSIFNKLRVPQLREAFIAFFQKYYEEWIASLESGRELSWCPEGVSEAAHRAWIVNNWRETRAIFLAEVELLAGLEEWFLLTRELPRGVEEGKPDSKAYQIVQALEGFPYYLEQLLEQVWKETQEGGVTNG